MKLNKILFVVILFVAVSFAQKEVNFEELNSYFERAYKEFNLPGLAVGIIKDGEVVFKKGYGYQNTESKTLITPQTVFGVASVSKAFTGAAILMLVDEKKIKLDDKVIKYLPDFRLNDYYITKELTIRDLLIHRVGLATFDGDKLWYGTNYSREEVIERIRELPVKNSFRSKFGYQNIMYIVAGELIKKVTGKTWDEFTQERIFNPLEMKTATTTNIGFENRNDVAFPHVDNKPQYFIDYDNSGPAASINASVEDLLQWAKMWLQKGKFNDNTILSPTAYYTAISSQMMLSGGQGEEVFGQHFFNYGLGWFLSDYYGRKLVYHDGGLPGIYSKVLFIPEEKLGIVVLSNELINVGNTIKYKIIDAFINDKETDYITRDLENIKRYKKMQSDMVNDRINKRILGTSPSLEMEKYSGEYEDKMYGKTLVNKIGDDYYFTMVPTAKLFNGKMEHWHYDTFKVQFADPFLTFALVTFKMNKEGDVEGFTIDLPNPDFHFYNLDFEKIK